MNLLVVNWQDARNPGAGGAEVHLHEIFRRLASAGHNITLLVSGWRGAPERERVDGMEVHRVGTRHTFPVQAPIYYRRTLRRKKFDLLIEDLNKVPLWSPLWAECPVMLLVHHLFGATAFSTASFPVAAATWMAELPLARAYRDLPVQVVSHSTAADMVKRGFRPDQIHVVHNGVDSAFYRADPMVPRTPDPTLLYIGRLQPYKRVDLAVRALGFMRKVGVEARLRIAGSGPQEGPLRRLAERIGVGRQVEFLGFVDLETKRRLFRTSWLHVLTSPKEGWGLTVMEAAACGTPTVGSASPGLCDSVAHRETGLLLPHGDWTDLGRQLATLLDDPDSRERMGLAARARAESFSWERSASEAERSIAAAARPRLPLTFPLPQIASRTLETSAPTD
jgi:glycosyltransferase involved in cell wall biosynthesis